MQCSGGVSFDFCWWGGVGAKAMGGSKGRQHGEGARARSTGEQQKQGAMSRREGK